MLILPVIYVLTLCINSCYVVCCLFLHISIYIKLEKQLTTDNPKHEVK